MKKIINIAIFVLFTVSLNAQSVAEKMAATVMHIWKDTATQDGGRPLKWTYDQGVVLKGMEGLWYKTGDAKYFYYIQHCMDYFVGEQGEIKSYKQTDFNIDNVLTGRALILLYNVTGKEKYYKAALNLREQLKLQPRTSDGGFWHKKIYPNQMWLDGLYMGEPFYALFADSFTEPEAFNDIAHQFILMENHARDAKTGLLYHGWDETKSQKWANPVTGVSPHFWARAMGWYGMALVDVLEYFPADNHKKDSLIAILKRFANAVKSVQDPKTGLWYDILNLPTAKGNYTESSASSMFVYTISKAVRLGYLDAAYLSIAKKGYDGILKEFIETDANGQTNLKRTVTVSGLGGTPYRDGSYEYYMSEKVITNDRKGVGAFLQAANEMDMLPTLGMGKGKTVMLDDYFNSEKKKDILGVVKPYHYKWYEQYNNGISFLGNIFHQYGMKTATLSEAPNRKNLASADIYMIIDADNTTDNPTPNYVSQKDADELYEWVKSGGILVLLHNDKGNAEFEHFNKIPEKFGIHYNEDSYNRVQGNEYATGKVEIPAGNPILPHVKKIYQKEISSITVKSPATSMLTKDGINIFAVAKVGKGTVFATGDPWLYNEYTDNRKIPLEYENSKAAHDLIQWLIKQAPQKIVKK